MLQKAGSESEPSRTGDRSALLERKRLWAPLCGRELVPAGRGLAGWLRGPDSDKADLASGQNLSSGLEQVSVVQAQKGPS